MLQETLEDVDRRVERSAGRAILLLAIPPAIGHLLAEQPLDDACHVLAEVRAERNDASVDARFDLAREHGPTVPRGSWVVPRRVVANEAYRVSRLVARRVEAHVAEHQQVEQRDPLRVGRAGAPQPTLPPERQEARAPAF